MTNLIKRASAEVRAFGRKNDNRKSKRERDEDDLANAPRKPRFAPVTFSEEGGVRSSHHFAGSGLTATGAFGSAPNDEGA